MWFAEWATCDELLMVDAGRVIPLDDLKKIKCPVNSSISALEERLVRNRDVKKDCSAFISSHRLFGISISFHSPTSIAMKVKLMR